MSKSLLSNLQKDYAQFNKLSLQGLSLNSSNTTLNNSTKDDDELVLITLNISGENVFEDRIEFQTENLKLTEWSNRTLNSDTKYNYNIQYENKAALSLLENIFNKKTQGKYNATDNPPNLILILNNEDYYEILTGINVVDNQITLYLQPQSNTKMLPVTENTNLKIIIDAFTPNYSVKLGNIVRYNAFLVSKNNDSNDEAIVQDFNFMIFENSINSRYSLFSTDFPTITFYIRFRIIYIQLNDKSINITNEGINFRLLFRNKDETIFMEYTNPIWWTTLRKNLRDKINTYIYLGTNKNEKIEDLARRLLQ
jgi:hypothetical protein